MTQQTYSSNKNALGVSNAEFEAITNLRHVINTIAYNLTRRKQELDLGAKKGVMTDAKLYAESVENEIPGLLAECKDWLGRMPSELTYDTEKDEVYSNCCGASPVLHENGIDSVLLGVCPKCGEHAAFYPE